MGRDWLGMLHRGLKKPPRYLLERLTQEIRGQAERQLAPLRLKRLGAATLARQAGFGSVDAWWDALAQRPYLIPIPSAHPDLETLCPGDSERILQAAARALAHQVDLLGSGLVELGADIDWHCDYKTSLRWPPAFCRDIEYNNPERPSDVKFPWEVSRMQWWIPVAQAYQLTHDERYAVATRALLEHWIRHNPYAHSVNWACTMDVALRLFTWTYFFHVFKQSAAWSDTSFRARFLQALFLHGDFTARNLERSDINGNHYTADAAGLVIAGLFFGTGKPPQQWLTLGWNILMEELPRQVFPDGVDFEASVPYHRLVQELFLLPALYRLRHGLTVPETYRARVKAMARFTAAYCRSDGSVPLWGDADDARTLPFGDQALNDHRYLLSLVGLGLGSNELLSQFSGSRSEAYWLFGAEAAGRLSACLKSETPSQAFPDGGFYVLRNATDHVFVDCGPLGLAGRGGHGHNDLLSFEAVLAGVHLISDCGAYLYTANYQERNAFRSTAYHNTPQLDDEEINRFMRWDYLWTLHNDAPHEVREVRFGPETDELILAHGGYQRLASPVTVVRSFRLHHGAHRLEVTDAFEGDGDHLVEIPWHLAAGVSIRLEAERGILTAGGKSFALTWSPAEDWEVHLEACRLSPSYGIVQPSQRLVWRREGRLRPLSLTLQPLEATVP